MHRLRFGTLHAAAITVVALACGTAAADDTPASPPAPKAIARIDAALQNVTTIVRSGRVGYATVWDGNKYVQCRRQTDRAMRCEAAGATLQPSLSGVLTGERLGKLFALGWRLDPSFGNYVRIFPAETPTATIAEQIAQTLVEGYGAELEDLERATTWIEDVPCPPRNGPTQNLAGIVSDAPSMRPTALRKCSYTPEPATPQKVGSAAELIARSGATVAAEIQRLRINADSRVFAVFDVGIGYVQCMPETPARDFYCEAQSPESWPALATVITPERLARLHAAGYADPGRGPNYWKKYRFDKYSNAAVADEILTILFDVYGYAGATPLDVKTE